MASNNPANSNNININNLAADNNNNQQNQEEEHQKSSPINDHQQQEAMDVVQENGQRKWGGPPADWSGPAPPKRGTEVFVGKLPRDLTEKELLPVLQQAGRVYELRLMIDFSGGNRGYCFATYATKEEAKSACEMLNNYEIREGKHIGVVISIDNCRLFVGGIPRDKKRDEILSEISKLVEGVQDVILYQSANDKSRNRGFAFVEFETHKLAAQARRKLFPGRIQMWGQPICVDWAEPEQEVDDQTMSQVKVLYVRNLMLSTSEEAIKAAFEQLHPGSVERVKKLKDFAFVHFTDRQQALDTLAAMNGSVLDGANIEVQLSKPPDRTIMRFVKNAQRGGGGGVIGGGGGGVVGGGGGIAPSGNVHQDLVAAAAQSYLQQNSHHHGLSNLAFAPSSAIPTMAAAAAADPLTWAFTGSPLIHTPAANSNLPVQENSGYPAAGGGRHGHRGAAGLRGAGFQAHVSKQVRNARRRTSEAALMCELYPYPTVGGLLWLPTAAVPHHAGGAVHGGVGMAAAAAAAAAASPAVSPPAAAAAAVANLPQGTKKASQQLEEYCASQNLGKPSIEANGIVTKTVYGQEVTLYIGKVGIPMSNGQVASFNPNRSWASQEEAKEFAALFTLLQLANPTGGTESGSISHHQQTPAHGNIHH